MASQLVRKAKLDQTGMQLFQEATMSTYRVSYFRPAGWLRLGMAASVAMVLITPMVWAVHGFGTGDDVSLRTLVFLIAGAVMPLVVAVIIGWAMRGFAVKVHTEDEEDSPPHRPASVPHPPAAASHHAGHK